MAVTPKLSVSLTGSELTNQRYEKTFTVETKVEKIYSITNLSSDITLDLDNLTDVNFILIHSTGSAIVEITPLVGEPLVDGDVTTLILNADYPCILPVNDASLNLISSIKISTTSTTALEVTYQAYGV